MTTFKKFAGFIKIEHTLFSLPLLFAGAYLAGHAWPSLRTSFLIVVAGASARVVAMGLNRIIDREIDRLNPRTQQRHLPSGAMSLLEAWAAVSVSLLLYLLSAWLLSDFCLRLSWIPLVAFASYPYFKRFTHWAHLGLGLVWSLVPLAGFFAVEPSLDGIGPAVLLGVFCLFWLAGFDIIYATLDEDFDREYGVYSLPAAWGRTKALRAAALFHLLSFFTLVFLYGVYLSGPLTVMLLTVVGLTMYVGQKFSSNVDFAFFQVNAFIGLAVLIFIFIGSKGF